METRTLRTEQFARPLVAAGIVLVLALAAVAVLSGGSGAAASDHALAHELSEEHVESCHRGCDDAGEAAGTLIDIQHGNHCDLVPVSCFGQTLSTGGSPLAADLGSLVMTTAAVLHQSDPPSEIPSSDTVVLPQSPPPRVA